MVKHLLSQQHVRLILALLAGAGLPLAYAPFTFYPIAFIAPAILFYLWLEATPKQAALSGFLFGLGLFGVGVSWVYVAIHDFGFASLPLALLLTALFVATLALFFALQGYVSVWLQRGIQKHHHAMWLIVLLLYPAVWVLLEWVRGWFLTGFPWLLLGYSQIDSGLNGFASWLGVYGLSWISALTAGLLLLLLHSWQKRSQLIMLGAVVAIHLLGYAADKVEWTEPAGQPIKVSLIQGNLSQMTKWDPNAVQTRLKTYAELTAQHWDSQLIIWPENAITAFYHKIRAGYLDVIEQQARENGTDIVLGLPVMDPTTRDYYSSMISLGSTPGQYHKRHLVPFGEYLPLDFLLRGVIDFFNLPMSSFSPGASKQPLLKAAGQNLAVTICFEDVFAEEVIEALPEATLLVNGSNNAWYGNSFAPHQHLQIARMRALETGRPLLRVTTNGISAFVDHKGVITHQSPQFKTYVLNGDVQPRQGATLYVRVGNYPVIVFVLVLIGFVFIMRRKKSFTH